MKDTFLYSLYKHDDILEIIPLTKNKTITLQGSDAVLDFITSLLNCYQESNKFQSCQTEEVSLDGSLVNKILQQEQTLFQ